MLTNFKTRFKELFLKVILYKLIIIYILILGFILFSIELKAQYSETITIQPTTRIIKINNQDVCLKVIYRVQLMVLTHDPAGKFFHSNVIASKLHSSSNIWCLYSENYYHTKEEATSALKYYRGLGYSDCFIVKSYIYSLHSNTTINHLPDSSNMVPKTPEIKDTLNTVTMIIGDKDTTPVSYDNNLKVIDYDRLSKKKITILEIPLYLKSEKQKNE